MCVAVNSSLKVNGEQVVINPLLSDMKHFLHFELAPYPLFLFCEYGLKERYKVQVLRRIHEVRFFALFTKHCACC